MHFINKMNALYSFNKNEKGCGQRSELRKSCKFDKIKNEPNEINELARKITIRKNGNPISFPKEYYNGIYTRVTSSNNGDKYECEVDNRFYTRTSDTVEVNVQCKFQKRQ